MLMKISALVKIKLIVNEIVGSPMSSEEINILALSVGGRIRCV